ncbi:MAG: pantoate--beta-alanine ligase [Burkholderiales bacterium]
MEVLRTISALRERLKGETGIAFVPTMGNLHQGHLELMRIAREHAGCVVASLFVNRLQFGQGEDFDRYPRTFNEDCEKLGKAGVDVLFAPEESELYPVLQEVTLNLPPIAEELCGASRPGHFRGMATVVLKLFNIVRPDYAVFGKKDCQQLHLVRKMISQLDLPISIVAGETVREADGLAMSSRNRYLTAAERLEATRLHYNLEKVKLALVAGERDFRRLESEARQDLANRGWKVDYLEVREAESLEKPGSSDKKLVVLGAAWLGKTRLIDNLEAS